MRGKARKKNLQSLLKATSLKWSPLDCVECLEDPEFADELIDGIPQCEACGVCKHFASCKGIAPKGNPMRYIDAGGLWRFEQVSNRLLSLSSWDGAKLPTIDAYPFCTGELDMEEELFQDLLAMKLATMKETILVERQRTMQNG